MNTSKCVQCTTSRSWSWNGTNSFQFRLICTFHIMFTCSVYWLLGSSLVMFCSYLFAYILQFTFYWTILHNVLTLSFIFKNFSSVAFYSELLCFRFAYYALHTLIESSCWWSFGLLLTMTFVWMTLFLIIALIFVFINRRLRLFFKQ